MAEAGNRGRDEPSAPLVVSIADSKRYRQSLIFVIVEIFFVCLLLIWESFC